MLSVCCCGQNERLCLIQINPIDSYTRVGLLSQSTHHKQSITHISYSAKGQPELVVVKDQSMDETCQIDPIARRDSHRFYWLLVVRAILVDDVLSESRNSFSGCVHDVDIMRQDFYKISEC